MARHGVDFSTAQRAFADPKALFFSAKLTATSASCAGGCSAKVDARILPVRYTHRAARCPRPCCSHQTLLRS